MSANISDAFIAQYAAEVKAAYQQKNSKLRSAVRVVTGVTGSTHNFPVMGAVVANTKATDADVTPLNPTHGFKTATLANSYAPILIDKLDAIKTNADYRKEYVMASAAALGRKTDQVIVGALDTVSASTAITTTAGGFTLEKLLECLEGMNTNDVNPEDRFFTLGPKQLSEALALEKLTSADYAALKGIMSGNIDSAFGFNWILSNQLTTVDTTTDYVKCYAFAKSAVGLAVGQDITTTIDPIPMKVSNLVNSYMSLGSVVIDPLGVYLMQCEIA